ncbi:hypothetical protein BTUL_0071g00360 [Botrytis tulipae]|uniref:Uncharacterized protein n=1 Tax=Botrytis tulipae TaxID=87230 RepID=A0A4Z1EQ05_9HELO|nr:hypothetical protein BTUL_0071g00360 [Botrytis tulipae]
MSPAVLRAAITCSLHHLWDNPDARLPRNHQVNVVGKDQDAERPVIYALVHCSPTGQAATKIQILECISGMEQYIDRWYEGSLEWEIADTLASEIDHFKYKSWASGTSGKCNWKKGLHPRRFAGTSGAREQIGEFCRSIRARLSHMPDDEESRVKPLPWTVVYVGYTGKEAKRAYQHERHETGGPVIPYLFETIMMMKFRDCQYLLRNMSIMNITRLSDVRCAEHVVSILASSYSEHGGLNGTLGGPVALETRARSISKQGWQNATRALVNQGVFDANDSLVKKQLENRSFFEKYEDEGSELHMLKKKTEEVTKTRGELRDIFETEHQNVANIAYLRTRELETDIQITRNVGRLASLMNINDRLVKLRGRVTSNVPPLSMDRSDIESQADDELMSSITFILALLSDAWQQWNDQIYNSIPTIEFDQMSSMADARGIREVRHSAKESVVSGPLAGIDHLVRRMLCRRYTRLYTKVALGEILAWIWAYLQQICTPPPVSPTALHSTVLGVTLAEFYHKDTAICL